MNIMASYRKLLFGVRNIVQTSQTRFSFQKLYGSACRNFATTSLKNFPICTVDTNLQKSDLPTGLAKDLCNVVAQILNKPIETVTVTIRPGSDIYRRGSDAPVLSVQIWSIGVFDAERNPDYSKALYHYLQTTTKLPADRICLLFHPIKRDQAGHLLYEDFLKLNKIDLHK